MTKKPNNPRGKHVRVKTAKGRTTSQQRWLSRQLNDPYVKQARSEGYRSRASYKLIEMDDKFQLLKPGMRVVDLGAAPGSWTQVAVERVLGTSPRLRGEAGGGDTAEDAPTPALPRKRERGLVIGLDLQEMEPIEGVTLLLGDFQEEAVLKRLEAELGGQKLDLVMSDMAANTTGHTQTDHIRIIALCEIALDFALQWLKPGGNFVAKVLRGGTEQQLLVFMKKHFASVKHYKPAASRADSAEMYVVALGFRDA